MGEMENAAGATEEAYNTMDQGIGRQIEKILNEFKLLGIEIGQEFLPVLRDDLLPIIKEDVVPVLKTVIEKIKELAQWFKELTPEQKKQVATWVGIALALGPALSLIGKISTGLGTLKGLLIGTGVAAGTAKVGLIAMLSPFALLAAGVYGLYLVFTDLDGMINKIRDNLTQLGNIIAEKFAPFKAFVDWFGKASASMPDWMKFDPNFNLLKPGSGTKPHTGGGRSFAPAPSVRSTTNAKPAIMGEGGIVTKPTMALIGEAGESEAVIPLSKMGQVMNSTVEHTGTITVKGVNDRNQLQGVAELVLEQLRWEVRMA
jgi:hypothetical protein